MRKQNRPSITHPLEGEIYDFGTPGATEDSRPIGYATCRFCRGTGWLGKSIDHRLDCIILAKWKRAPKLRRKK